MSTDTDSVRWGHTKIDFTYEFARRKTMAISVHPDLTVTVKVPEGTPIEGIKEKVLKRAPWIQSCRREFELYLPKQPPRRYTNGESHRYLGRQYRLKADQGEMDSVKCLRGYLWVTTKGEPTPKRVQTLLEGWYREHARKIFGDSFSSCFQKAARTGIPQPTLVIRKMSNRWGSCSPSSRIMLNLELIKASRECIDYVMIHELCHMKERHHGPRFWKLLEKLMPDFRERKKKLNLFADV
jgi:predicted metal-dependent hydrolase